MAVGQVRPFVAVAGSQDRVQRPFRILGAAAVALALLAATVAVQHGQGDGELMQGSDEKVKGWEDGMFPPHATFPAGYHFGDDNVFGKYSKFGAGDTFGDDNVFGKGSTYGAGSKFGSKNAFGKKQKFGPGTVLGDWSTVGGFSSFEDGTVIGSDNQFGREVEFGRRVSIGRKNQFGGADEFGSNDQLGAKNEFGRGVMFGDKIMFGKKQEFGGHDTFASPEFLVGQDEFGSRNWGLKDSDLPVTDKKLWENMAAHYPDYIPERYMRKRVLTLHQHGKTDNKKAAVKKQAAIKAQAAEATRKSQVFDAIEKAAQHAEAETKRLKEVAASLKNVKA